MFFASRSRRGPDRFLGWKTGSLFGGIGLGLLGMTLQSRWIVSVAILVVLVGFGLRFLPHRNTD